MNIFNQGTLSFDEDSRSTSSSGGNQIGGLPLALHASDVLMTVTVTVQVTVRHQKFRGQRDIVTVTVKVAEIVIAIVTMMVTVTVQVKETVLIYCQRVM